MDSEKGFRHVRNNRWCVLVAGKVPEAGWAKIADVGIGDDSVVLIHTHEHEEDVVVQAWDDAREGGKTRIRAHRGAYMSKGWHPTVEEAVADLEAMEVMLRSKVEGAGA